MSKTYCPHGCIDPCTPECVTLRATHDDLMKREALVREVIRLIGVFDADIDPRTLGIRRHDVLEACRELAGWKP